MRAGDYFYAETKHGGVAMGFKPAPEENWSGEAKTAQEALTKWGIEVIVFDGEMHTNQRNVTEVSTAGKTLCDGGDITVFLSSALDIDGLETAYHEALHAIRTGPNVLHRVKIENIILDSVNMDCVEFENFVTRIADLYAYAEKKVSEERFATEIMEEVYAWYVGKLHAADAGDWGLEIAVFSDAETVKAKIDAIYAKMEVSESGEQNGVGLHSEERGVAVRGVQEAHSAHGDVQSTPAGHSEGDHIRENDLQGSRDQVTTEQIEQKEALGNQELPKGNNDIIPEKGGVKLPTTPRAR